MDQSLQEIYLLQQQRLELIQRQQELAKKEQLARIRLLQLIEKEEQEQLVGKEIIDEINQPAWSPSPIRRSRSPHRRVHARPHGHFGNRVPAVRKLDMTFRGTIPWDQEGPRDQTIQAGLIFNNNKFVMHPDRWEIRRPFLRLDFGKEPITDPTERLLK